MSYEQSASFSKSFIWFLESFLIICNQYEWKMALITRWWKKFKNMNKNKLKKLFLSYQLNNPPKPAAGFQPTWPCLYLPSKKEYLIPNFCIYLYSLHQIKMEITIGKAFWVVFADLINIPCDNNNWEATSNMSHHPVKFWTIFHT